MRLFPHHGVHLIIGLRHPGGSAAGAVSAALYLSRKAGGTVRPLCYLNQSSTSAAFSLSHSNSKGAA